MDLLIVALSFFIGFSLRGIIHVLTSGRELDNLRMENIRLKHKK